jgi:hypothetical protein
MAELYHRLILLKWTLLKSIRLFLIDLLRLTWHSNRAPRRHLPDRSHGAGGSLKDNNEMPTAANDNDPLGTIYKFDEVAAKLRVGKRSLQEIIKSHPHYARNGRVYLFSENDIRLI